MPRMQKEREPILRRLFNKVRTRNEKQGWYSILLYDAAAERGFAYQFNGVTYAEACKAAEDAYRAEYEDGSEYVIIVCVQSA